MIQKYFNFLYYYKKENYGRNNKNNVKKIKKLFNELELEKEYFSYEEEKFQLISKMIDSLEFKELTPVQIDLIKSILNLYSKKIFKRNK